MLNAGSGTDGNLNDDAFVMNSFCDYFDSNDFNNLNLSQEGQFSIFYMNSRSLCRHFYDIQD